MRKASSESEPLSPKQAAEVQAMKALPDDQIDTTNIPEVTDWSRAERGKFYRPIKQQITLRLDADVIEWFKGATPGGRGYQTAINRALRDYMRAQIPRSR